MLSRRHRIKGYLAFHSFGNKILYPWGHTSTKTRDWKDLRTFAKVAADAIKKNSQAQRRSFTDFITDPLVNTYSVSQQSIRTAPETESDPIKNTMRRIFLGPGLAEEVSQTKEVLNKSQADMYILLLLTPGVHIWAST